MKNKLLLTASLSGIACLSVIMAGSLLSKNNTFNAVRSTATDYELIMNKDTIYQAYCYRDDLNYKVEQNAFFQLHYQGNYAIAQDMSYSTGVFGGDHLYTYKPKEVGTGACFMLDINAMRNSSHDYFFDQEKTRKIYMPGFDNANLNEIELTLNKDNEIPFDTSIFDSTENIEQDGNTYTISNITKNRNSIALFDFIATSAQIGKSIIIDQVIVRYTCGQPQ